MIIDDSLYDSIYFVRESRKELDEVLERIDDWQNYNQLLNIKMYLDECEMCLEEIEKLI